MEDIVQIQQGPQTDTDQLDGTASKGLFSFSYKPTLYAIFARSDLAANFTFNIILPNPAGGGSTTYPWQTFTGVTFAAATGELKLPQGAQVQVVTNNVPGANPTTSVIYSETI